MDKEKKESLKDWCKAPFKQLIEDVNELQEHLRLIIFSIQRSTRLPQTLEAIHNYRKLTDSVEGELQEEQRIEAHKQSSLATEEINKGFPFIFNQATILLYSHLESLIKEIITSFIKNNPDYITLKEFSTLKIQLSEYEGLNQDEKFDYIYFLYERAIAPGFFYGTKRFEALLAPIKMNGAVNSITEKNIFELAQLRNVLLHKSGRVDKTLIERCPWLNLKFGDKILVNHIQYKKYCDSVVAYNMTVFYRFENIYQVDLSETKIEYSGLE